MLIFRNGETGREYAVCSECWDKISRTIGDFQKKISDEKKWQEVKM